MADYNHDPVVPRVGVEADLAAATAIANEILWTSDTYRLYVEQGGVKKLVGEPDFLKLTGGSLSGDLTMTGTADIIISSMSLGSPTYSSLTDFANSFGSVGRKTGGAITDAGSGYIAVAAGTGFIKASDDDNAPLLFFDWAAPSNIEIPSDSTRYIGVEYNDGSPQVVARTSWNWNLDSEFPLGRVINETVNGVDTLHILNNPWWVTDGITNVVERFRAEGRIVRDQTVGGLILSVPDTSQHIAVSAGTLWSNFNEFDIAAVDTSVSGTVEAYYYLTGTSSPDFDGWHQADVSQYSITQWNNPAASSLQNLDDNKYACVWAYACAGANNVAILYPQMQHVSSASAEAESPPSTLPEHISQNGILLGKIIIQEGTAAAIAVLSAFTTVFSATAASDHGNLTGLADDDHTQYILVDGTRAFSGDILLNSGLALNWDGGDVTLTHSANTLTLAGGTLALGSNSLTMTGSIGATGARVTKGWFTDLEVTNAIAGSITGNAATVSVADTTDTTCYVAVFESASGSLAPKTDAGILYNAGTGTLSVDHITEITGAHGVLIDSWTIKDGGSGVITGGTNTFNITNGTASFDVAAACAVDIDASVNIDKALTVNGAFGTVLASNDQENTLTLNESLTVSDGSNVTLHFTDAKTLTMAENLTIGDGYDVTITAQDAASSITLDEQSFEVEGEGTETRLFKLVNSADSARTVTYGADFTLAGYDLIITTYDAARKLYLNEDLTIGGGYAGTITFAGESKVLTLNESLTVGDGHDVTITAVDDNRSITLNESLIIGGGYDGTLTYSAASKTLTVSESITLNAVAAGALMVASAANTYDDLAAGSAGQILKSAGAGSVPTWNTAAALTKTDDTNVTLTLGGSPDTALVNAASLTLGWTGTLAIARGGTGASTVEGALANLGLTDPLVYKGAIDCSANPNYPAADCGHFYRVSVAGRIGGASGEVVEVGDSLICNTDESPGGTQAEVGDDWNVFQVNVDFASPPAIGNTTPNTGAFTTVNATTGFHLNGAATAGTILRGNGTNIILSTSTFADTYTAYNLLYASAANTVTGLATANSGVLVTDGSGVPSISTDIPTAVTIGSAYIYRTGGTDVPVTDGGTGVSTLTDHGILLGSGTGAITALAAATNGQIPIGSTGADPVLATITAGDGIDITNGAGSIEIDVDLKANGGLVIESTELAVDLGASSITGTLAVGDGGTGATSLTDGGLLVGAGSSAIEALAVGLTTQILVGGGAGTNPAWGTDIPTAVTIGSAYIYRVGGTDVAVGDGGTNISTYTQGDILYASASDTLSKLAKSAGSNYYLKNSGTSNNPAWAAVTQADVVGLTVKDSPVFETVKLSNLSNTYFPYHVDDETGFADSPILCPFPDIYPATTYTTDLGSLSKKFLSLHAAELWVETLVAQETMATIGGRILVAPTTELTSDLAAAGTTIAVKYNDLADGDIVYMQSYESGTAKVEWIKVDSSASGTGPYEYTVIRDLDGTGANDWYAGDAIVNTGVRGDGFIDLYSYHGIPRAVVTWENGTEWEASHDWETARSTYGPTIVGNVRKTDAYNDFMETWAIGNLSGVYGCSENTYGVGLGRYESGNYILIDADNGIRYYDNYKNMVGQLSASVWTLGSTSTEHIRIDSSSFQVKDGSSVYTDLTAGVLTLGLTGDTVVIDNTGMTVTSGGTEVASFGATTYIGDQSNEHIKLSTSGTQVYDGATLLATYGSSTTFYDTSGADRLVLSTGGVTIGDVTEGEYGTFTSSEIALYGGGTQTVSILNTGAGWLGKSDGISWDTSGDITVAGNVTANTGYIGGTSGWVIASGKMTSTGIGLATTEGDATYAFWAGNDTPADAKFSVTHAGGLTSTSGLIANWSITETSLQTGAFDTNGTMYFGTSGISLSDTFKVTAAGVLTATGANISGTVTITSGSGYANITDKPTALENINSDEGTKLEGIEPGADVTSTHTAANTTNVGTLAASSVQGWAHASDTTKIDGGDIYTGSVTAAKITVTSLSALTANMGSLTSGSIVIGSTNKLWLNDSDDGSLNIGGSVKGSAPFQVTAAGVLSATGATISGDITATAGTIGGFTVNATEGLYAGTDATRVQMKAGAGIWAGATAIGDAPFSVTNAGALVATSATITGDITATSGYFTTVTLGKTGTASGTLTLQLNDGGGNTYINYGKTDFTNVKAGFILGIDDSDSDLGKFYIGNADAYLNWTGTTLDINVNANAGGSEGIIFKDGKRWLYDFNPAHNGTVQPDGYNLFVGVEAGNLTMGSTATTALESSYNIGIGYRTLYSVTTGTTNVGIGYACLNKNETGDGNTAIGHSSLRNLVSGDRNVGVGDSALRDNTGDRNTALGSFAGYRKTSGNYNVIIGYNAFGSVASGSSNVSIGTGSAPDLTSGSYNVMLGSAAGDTLDNGLYNIYIGSSAQASAAGVNNEIVIGYNATGNGSNTVTIGNTSITNNYFNGNINLTDAAFLGLGAAKGRIQFDDEATDEISFLDCVVNFPNSALRIKDTGDNNYLIVATGSDLTANKTLTLTTGDADRTITLSGNPTLNDWFDQSVKAAASPVFGNLCIGGEVEIGAAKTLNIANGTAPSEHVDNQIIIYSTDSPDSTSSLGLYLEQAVEDLATFAVTNKVKVSINGEWFYLLLEKVGGAAQSTGVNW